METLVPILAGHPFFNGLKDEYLRLIADCASNVRFDAGQFICREGEGANSFYLVRHGMVAVEIHAHQRGAITIQTLGEGEILGWSWIVPPYNWRFDARAIELTRAIALDAKCLRGKCEQNNSFGYELMRRFAGVITQRLEATRMQLLDVYGPRA